MRLNFNVLWVDDQPVRVDAQIRAIERRMVEEGFEFRPTKCSSIKEVKQFVSGSVFNDEIDLVLVDWDLGGGDRGQDAIALIREAIPYKDVVFYSASNNADELRRLAHDSQLEGIYCASRDDLVDETLGVFDSLIKKVLDLDHTRGIVMGATSDIDAAAHACLIALHDKSDEAAQAAMVAQAIEYVEDRVKRINKIVEKLREKPTLSAILKEHMIFTANEGLRMLNSALEADAFKKDFGRYQGPVKAYMAEIVPVRNDLGHRLLSPEGRPVAVAMREGKEMKVEDLRQVRRRLLELRKEFRDLHQLLHGIVQ